MGFRIALGLALAVALLAAFALIRSNPESSDEIAALRPAASDPAAPAPSTPPADSQHPEPRATGVAPTASPEGIGRSEPPGPLAEDPLLLFEQGNSDQRTKAVRELGRLAVAGDQTARQALIDALQDPETQVRQAAVRAIGNLRDPSLVPFLAPLVNDPEEDIREDMVKSLAKMRSEAASEVLEKLVSDEDPDVVEDAIQALISADGRNATSAIRNVSISAEPWLAAKAAKALRAFGDDAGADAALARIAEGLESSNINTRRETVGWIEDVGGSAAISYLQEATRDPSDAVARQAARAIHDLTAARLED